MFTLLPSAPRHCAPDFDGHCVGAERMVSLLRECGCPHCAAARAAAADNDSVPPASLPATTALRRAALHLCWRCARDGSFGAALVRAFRHAVVWHGGVAPVSLWAWRRAALFTNDRLLDAALVARARLLARVLRCYALPSNVMAVVAWLSFARHCDAVECARADMLTARSAPPYVAQQPPVWLLDWRDEAARGRLAAALHTA